MESRGPPHSEFEEDSELISEPDDEPLALKLSSIAKFRNVRQPSSNLDQTPQPFNDLVDSPVAKRKAIDTSCSTPSPLL